MMVTQTQRSSLAAATGPAAGETQPLQEGLGAGGRGWGAPSPQGSPSFLASPCPHRAPATLAAAAAAAPIVHTAGAGCGRRGQAQGTFWTWSGARWMRRGWRHCEALWVSSLPRSFYLRSRVLAGNRSLRCLGKSLDLGRGGAGWGSAEVEWGGTRVAPPRVQRPLPNLGNLALAARMKIESGRGPASI